MHIIFETPNLILRQLTEADAPLILSLNSDPEVVKYLHEPTLKTVEHAAQIINDIILPQYKKTWAAGPYIQKKEWILLAGAV